MATQLPNASLPIHVMRALLKLAPKDQSRPHLCGVNFDFACRVAAVTNGHYALLHKFESLNPVGCGTISRNTLEQVLKGVSKREYVDIYLSDRTFTIKAGSNTVTTVSQDYFPVVMRIVPSAVSLKRAQFDSHYLAQLQEALQAIHATDDYPIVASNGDTAGLMFLPKEKNTLAVLMPLRVEHDKMREWSKDAIASIKGYSDETDTESATIAA